MKTFKITVSDSATYYIKTNDKDLAEEIAVEWFSERKPMVNVSECNEKPDIEVRRF